MKSEAKTVEAYLAGLPEDRRAVVSAVREVIVANLPDGYEEAIGSGMLTYQVPLARYPKTYNKQPLAYVSLGAQKNHYAIYLLAPYANEEARKELEDGFAHAGKKLDMGKSCVRFKKLDDIPLDVIGASVASLPMERWIEEYERARGER